MSLPSSFHRTKLKSAVEMAKILTKLTKLVAQKKSAFNLEVNGQRILGRDMTNVDLLTSSTKITFTYNAVNYEILKANLYYFKRLRTQKYLFKTHTLTVVV